MKSKRSNQGAEVLAAILAAMSAEDGGSVQGSWHIIGNVASDIEEYLMGGGEAMFEKHNIGQAEAYTWAMQNRQSAKEEGFLVKWHVDDASHTITGTQIMWQPTDHDMALILALDAKRDTAKCGLCPNERECKEFRASQLTDADLARL